RLFFFARRRRHTRSKRDWSSDVCSSDLQREGKANAKRSLMSILGLFLKLNKGTIISWFFAFILLGGAYGSIYGDMQTFLESNKLIQQMFSQSGSTIEESFTGTIMMVMIGLVSILPIVVVNK